MRRPMCVFLTALGLISAPAIANDWPVTRLGGHPLYEASAVVRAPGAPGSWLVADNEESGELFLFSDDGKVLNVGTPDRIAFTSEAPGDLEALAEVDGRVAVVGSFSRGKKCKQHDKQDRRSILWVAYENKNLAELSRVSAIPEIDALQDTPKNPATAVSVCLANLFVVPAPPDAEVVCKALVEAEARSKAMYDEKKVCDTFNVEGAVGLPDDETGASPRLWLGLRSPVVPRGEGKSAAIMLRVKTGEAAPASLRFDAVRFVELGGRGIRSLDVYGDTLFGIAGGVVDERDTPNRWWKAPVADLLKGTIAPALEPGQLPPSAEGIGVAEEQAYVVIDGDKPEDGNPGVEAEQLTIVFGK